MRDLHLSFSASPHSARAARIFFFCFFSCLLFFLADAGCPILTFLTSRAPSLGVRDARIPEFAFSPHSSLAVAGRGRFTVSHYALFSHFKSVIAGVARFADPGFPSIRGRRCMTFAGTSAWMGRGGLRGRSRGIAKSATFRRGRGRLGIRISRPVCSARERGRGAFFSRSTRSTFRHLAGPGTCLGRGGRAYQLWGGGLHQRLRFAMSSTDIHQQDKARPIIGHRGRIAFGKRGRRGAQEGKETSGLIGKERGRFADQRRLARILRWGW